MLNSIATIFRRIFNPAKSKIDDYYLATQSNLVANIRSGHISANDAFVEVLRDKKLTADHFNHFRSHLVEQGLFNFSSPEEADANRENFDELTKLGVELGLMSEADANVLRGGFRATGNPTPLQKILFARFGNDFGVGEGTMKRDDPLIITDARDYIAIEYAIAKWALGQNEFKLEEQRTHQVEGRTIDELVYAEKPKGAPAWVHTRRFFFDITAGIGIK
jgi:hypothetical protein